MLALIVGVGTLVAAGEASASPDAVAAARCRGPAELANYRALAAGRRISTRRATCGDAKVLVRRFATACVAAHNSQGTCRIRVAGRRWSCASRLVGSLSAGVPSAITCTARRSSVRFTVKLSMSALAEPPGSPYVLSHPGPPFLQQDQCVDGDAAGPIVTPPPGPPNETFEVHAFGSVPAVVGEAVQAELVAHSVGSRLVNGLGVNPPSYPARVPVFLLKGAAQGITGILCSAVNTGSLANGSVVAIGESVEEAASVAAHELFHAHAWGIKASPVYPWFDDAAADWSRWRARLHFVPAWDLLLQQPNTAADKLELRYAMWRFVQFLDDKQMIHVGNTWPLIRAVIAGAPGESFALDQWLRGQGTSFGQELAEFWGQHLRVTSSRPPQLVPAPANSTVVQINPGRHEYPVNADALHTKLTDFRLSDGVKRVEFEFKPPTNGYFWGLTAADESRRFNDEATVSFCVTGANDGDLDWPGAFPVTFTNGFLKDSSLTGTIQIYAQAQADQCKGLGNKACVVLDGAGARGLLGPDLPNIGGYSGHGGVSHGRRYVTCAYKGKGGLGILQIDRWPSSKALRRWLVQKGKAGGWEKIALGDSAVILTTGGHTFVQIAVGRQRLSISVHGPGSRANAVALANDAIPQVR